MIQEERLEYVGSIVLGLNDALVELTGALAGYTFAFQNTRLIALTGLITGIAASLSMASSEFLAHRAEEKGEQSAHRFHLYRPGIYNYGYSSGSAFSSSGELHSGTGSHPGHSGSDNSPVQFLSVRGKGTFLCQTFSGNGRIEPGRLCPLLRYRRGGKNLYRDRYLAKETINIPLKMRIFPYTYMRSTGSWSHFLPKDRFAIDIKGL